MRMVEDRRAVSAFALFETLSFCLVDSLILGALNVPSTFTELQLARVPNFTGLRPNGSVIEENS